LSYVKCKKYSFREYKYLIRALSKNYSKSKDIEYKKTGLKLRTLKMVNLIDISVQCLGINVKQIT
jgi:hypothetical protein